jgi:hypothetical protein
MIVGAVDSQTDDSWEPAGAGVRRSESRIRSIAWPALAVALTVAVALARLWVTPAFYFADDTQTGTAGQWWRIGDLILHGRLPFLDPHMWTAGNYLAEGQWGVFNPLIWLFGVFTRVVGDALLAVTAIKIVMLGVMALGVHLLARSFGASAPWAAAAGVLATLGGFTVYMDAPSWTTGLLASAVFPWAWWGLRRLVEDRRGPLPFLVASALLITFGYVFGVIVLVVVLAEALIRALIRHDRRAAVTTFAAGVYAGLLTVAVYLPGILTAPVTIRGTSTILNGGFLNADLGDVAATSSALATASVGSWGTAVTPAPLMYVLWALPALALFVPSRALLLRLLPALTVGAVVLIVVLGPDQIGPIRWPVRFMPYVVIAVVVVFAAIATGARQVRSPRRALVTALAIVLGSAWFTVVMTPWEWRQIAVAVLCQVAGVVALWLVLYRLDPRRATGAMAAIIGAGVGVLLVVPQMALFPATILPKLPVVDAAAAAGVLGGAPADAIVVGDVYAGWEDPETYDERLVANQWYYSDTIVSSAYTVLPFRDYVTDICADLRGSTCAGALETLVSTDPATDTEVSTLLGVNTIVVIKASFSQGLPDTPTGWSVARDGEHTRLLVRDAPVETAGGVAWSSEGTVVQVLDQDDASIRLRVDAVGSDGRAVLSRLAWPGYSIDGASFADETRGYLLTVDLSEVRPGDVVTVQFRPPGWWLELGALALAVIGLVGWPVWALVRGRSAARALRAGRSDTA